jgi:hypothetical protein
MMVGWTDGRMHGWLIRRIGLAAVFLSACPTVRLSAQVGSPPNNSPFQDLPRGNPFVLSFGYLSGERGSVPVGPSNGATIGLRYPVQVGGPTSVVFSLIYANTDRFVVDPTDSAAKRRTGPFSSPVLMTDIGLRIALTGAKTWHGVSPYIGAALGLAFAVSPPKDPSGYDYGTKFTIAPETGIRWLPMRRMCVDLNARLIDWRLHYPLSYKQPGADSTRVLQLDASETEWTRHPWVSLGVGWTF